MEGRESVNLWSLNWKRVKHLESSSGANFPEEIAKVINEVEICSVADVINLKSHHQMLDIGAGTGRWTIGFARKVNSITALEPSEIYDYLKERAVKLGNINCLKQSFQEFESESGQFDIIIVSGVLMYIANLEEVKEFICKVASLLRKGGYFVLREPVARLDKYLIDWVYTGRREFFSKLGYCRYWEVIRAEKSYTFFCKSGNLQKVHSFVSHSPFFYQLNLRSQFLKKFIDNLIVKRIRMTNLKYIKAYNKILRFPYGKLRYFTDLRTMKIFIFQKV